MNKNLKVKDVMTAGVVVAEKSNNLMQVMEFFTRNNIHHLPVGDKLNISGIISLKDVVRFMNEHLKKGETISSAALNNEFSLEDVMTKNPTTIDAEASIDDALKILATSKFQAIPVLQDGKICGIVTNKDMVRAYTKERNPPASGNFSSSSAGFGV